jgi:hypothetical protein
LTGSSFDCIGNKRRIPLACPTQWKPVKISLPDHVVGQPANPAKKKDPSACNTVVSGAYNPLFKVLCIFPSRYLFAIGLEKIFSFR